MCYPPVRSLGRLLAGVAIAACHAASAETAPPVQPVPHPCEWLSPAVVEGIFGPLNGAPIRVQSARDDEPDAEGTRCLYRLIGHYGELRMLLEVDLNGAIPELLGIGMSVRQALRASDETGVDGSDAEQAAAALGALTRAPTGESGIASRPDAWDSSGSVPGLAIWRIGHVAVKLAGDIMLLPGDQLERLALQLRDVLADDRPFAATVRDERPWPRQPDPCSLLTRAEAEAVLGPLVVPPYRSSGESAQASATGLSCSYLARNHRALVLTPEFSDGALDFRAIAAFGGHLRSSVGGADHGDLLDGPWEQATQDAGGALYFLDGDRLLKMIYLTSSTDLGGAGRLAAHAVPRLGNPR
jgi:hypothetical protein